MEIMDFRDAFTWSRVLNMLKDETRKDGGIGKLGIVPDGLGLVTINFLTYLFVVRVN